ncbi:MAG: FkbM family methyltransferase [Candidatus Taylorbacteria bacterium]|nr:FkbM family methyltransferase [Candidatus Taylorbacteria bacterium]
MCIDIGFGKIILEEIIFKKTETVLGIISIYYDVIYPTLVSYPIKAIYVEGPYENKDVRLKEGDVILDCVANLGIFSFFASKKISNSGKVYAFEPIPDICSILKESISHSRANNIITVQSAVGNSKKEISFNFSDLSLGGSSANSIGKPTIVSQNTIDNFVKDNNVKKVDFIKMDIEGAERYALEGAKETIKNFKPRLAVCTYHLPDDPRVIKGIILN